MSAYGMHILMKANKFSYLKFNRYDILGDGRIEPFNELIHFIRLIQITTASRVKEFLEGSEIIEQENTRAGSIYSFRCIPQVHGASKDAIDYVKSL
jgi:histidine ammonia-lyase